MDKKFLIKTILLNTAWVAWIVLSIFLGYIIYREAFPSQPVVIIPFSLLFLVAGGAVAYIIYRTKKKRHTEKMGSLTKIEAEGETTEVSQCKSELSEEMTSGADINTMSIIEDEDISKAIEESSDKGSGRDDSRSD